MALIVCPECGKEISDKAVSCPYCGNPMSETPTQMNSETIQDTLVDTTSVSTQNKKKKIVLASAIAAIAIVLVVVGIIISSFVKASNAKKERNEYIDNLTLVTDIMLIGGAEAESLCNLTKSVWYNTIYEEWDVETDKYTRPEGYFLSDFNDSLANLYSDAETLSTTASISSNQDTVSSLMKNLQSPPDDCERCYDTLNDLYDEYLALTNLALSPTGNLQTYAETFNQNDSNFLTQYNKVKDQIPNKDK